MSERSLCLVRGPSSTVPVLPATPTTPALSVSLKLPPTLSLPASTVHKLHRAEAQDSRSKRKTRRQVRGHNNFTNHDTRDNTRNTDCASLRECIERRTHGSATKPPSDPPSTKFGKPEPQAQVTPAFPQLRKQKTDILAHADWERHFDHPNCCCIRPTTGRLWD
ncbi:hypothetical protein H0H81_002020 [Sphagnurus paluster]|uniref:Uncharacterized protein n=1 Tax=Sphagnurus paluster TaxID=117069 RepID=A0A9P7FMD5_9AGAR|nr:hypothetical protein H0H81_002020 [Sphagnurus paluster]